jgi:hypothetical protein
MMYHPGIPCWAHGLSDRKTPVLNWCAVYPKSTRPGKRLHSYWKWSSRNSGSIMIYPLIAWWCSICFCMFIRGYIPLHKWIIIPSHSIKIPLSHIKLSEGRLWVFFWTSGENLPILMVDSPQVGSHGSHHCSRSIAAEPAWLWMAVRWGKML